MFRILGVIVFHFFSSSWAFSTETVLVVGQVVHPGPQEVGNGLTLTELFEERVQLQPFAATNRIHLRREGKWFYFNLKNGERLKLTKGDYVYIPLKSYVEYHGNFVQRTTIPTPFGGRALEELNKYDFEGLKHVWKNRRGEITSIYFAPREQRKNSYSEVVVRMQVAREMNGRKISTGLDFSSRNDTLSLSAPPKLPYQKNLENEVRRICENL